MISPRSLVRLLSAVTLAACTSTSQQASPSARPAALDNTLMARARAIHQRVMTLDTHVDINPNQFNPNDTVNFAKGVPGRQVDLPKMEAGGYDAVFLAIKDRVHSTRLDMPTRTAPRSRSSTRSML